MFTVAYNGHTFVTRDHPPEQVVHALDRYQQVGRRRALAETGVGSSALYTWAQKAGVARTHAEAMRLLMSGLTAAEYGALRSEVRRLYFQHDRTLREIAAMKGRSVQFIQHLVGRARKKSEASRLRISPKRRRDSRTEAIVATCRTVARLKAEGSRTWIRDAAIIHGVHRTTVQRRWNSDLNPYTADR